MATPSPTLKSATALAAAINFNFGIQFNATPVIGIEGLYSFNGFGDKDLPPLNIAGNPGGSTQLADLSGDMSMQYGTASLIVQKPDGGVRPYGLVGMGLYYRKVRLTSPGVGWVPGYCDPWWYVCYPGGWVETTNILGDRSSTDFGMSFGGGVNFGVAYAELRYHYVWGPEVEARTVTGPARRECDHRWPQRPTASSFRRPSASDSDGSIGARDERSLPRIPPPRGGDAPLVRPAGRTRPAGPEESRCAP